MNSFISIQSIVVICLCGVVTGVTQSVLEEPVSNIAANKPVCLLQLRKSAQVSSAANPRALMHFFTEPALLQTMPSPPAAAEPLLQTLPAAVAESSNVTDGVPGSAANSTSMAENGALLPMTRFLEEPAPAILPEVAAAPHGLAGVFAGMRFTVVRIQAIVAKVDWLQPYKQPSDSPFIGSGFVVDTGNGDPVFLTNAHVVQDARVVQVQLPAIGQMIFDAYVPLICKRFDLAVVQLKEPKKFWEALAKHNGTVHALPIRPVPVSLGLEVAAVGFPLGSSSLKLSRGIISGTEMVDGTICYQSTAPISPGSSGGPLFAVGSESGAPGGADDFQVIGINFASSVSEGAQNINYVVPTIHLLQVLHEFRNLKATSHNNASVAAPLDHAEDQNFMPLVSKQKYKGDWHLARPNKADQTKQLYSHAQLRIAPIDAIGIESSEALYNTSGGCNKGVFLSRLLPTSALRFANPPVPERAFLTAVDNVTLDSFGMGRTANFLGDPTPFESLMMLRESVDEPVTLAVCLQGKETEHVVSMRWRPEYNVAVQDVEEPHFEDASLDFEIFAGVTMMQMTVNNIVDLLRSGRPQTLSRWLLIENQEVPRLLITHVEEGTYASRVLTPGMVVHAINGKNVSTLAELRDNFQAQGSAWTLETDRGLILSVKFKETLADQVTSAVSAPERHYLLSPAPLLAAKQMKLVRAGLMEFATGAESARVVAPLRTDALPAAEPGTKGVAIGRFSADLLAAQRETRAGMV